MFLRLGVIKKLLFAILKLLLNQVIHFNIHVCLTLMFYIHGSICQLIFLIYFILYPLHFPISICFHNHGL